MHTLIGMPQGAEWLIILTMFGALCLAPVAVAVWLIAKVAQRRH